MRYFTTFFIFVAFFLMAKAQDKNLIEWKNIQEGDSLQLKGDNRLLLIDVYTDWCGPCKLMDKITFHNEEVVAYINENFIPVKLNAEFKNDIIFKGKTYSWVTDGRSGIQSLAYSILGGHLSYPSVVLVGRDGEVFTIISGFYPAEEFLIGLKDLKKQIDNFLAKDKDL